jgi:hypothetical protein
VKPARPRNAPGYKCKANRDGTWREGWEARHDLVKRGYRPSWVRLFYPDTPDGRQQLSVRCKDLQGQMLAWAANGEALPKRGYDGTVRSLAHHFQTDEDSPYHGMKWNSQHSFDKTVKIIRATVGDRQIGKLLGSDFLRWSRNWSAPAGEEKPPRPWRGKHCIDAVRRIIAYGVTLGCSDCMRADNHSGQDAVLHPTDQALATRA